MAVTVQKRAVIIGSSCEEDIGGLFLTDVYRVDGIVPGINPYIQALDCPDIPTRGTPHPDRGNIFVQKRRPRPLQKSRNQMYVDVTYRPSEYDPTFAPTIEFHATTIPISRPYDANGTPIKLHWAAPRAGLVNGASIDAYGKLDGSKAVGILTADWVENADPSGRLLPLINCINSSPYKGFAKHCWWIKDLDIVKVRYHVGYRIHVELALDTETWIQTVVVRDIYGNIPKGVDLVAAATAPPAPPLTYDGYFRGTQSQISSFSSLGIPGVS
jgi:hypothetical protein